MRRIHELMSTRAWCGSWQFHYMPHIVVDQRVACLIKVDRHKQDMECSLRSRPRVRDHNHPPSV